jgi:hypothetical protein
MILKSDLNFFALGVHFIHAKQGSIDEPELEIANDFEE